jgi:signal transduction histidine kinase
MSIVTKTLHEFENYTVLLIDDDPTNLRILVEYLQELSFQVVVEPAGELGLKRAELLKPELILLDILMPGIDGFETCRRLKANQSTKDIPVIFMTALDSAKDKVKGFDIGGVDYVTKPFQRQEVLARILTHLRIRDLTLALNAKIDELIQTRNELVQSEKMASLGRMVAGFAHEINTPIGVAVGSASTLYDNADDLDKLLEQEQVNEEDLLEILATIKEAAQLTLSNLKRAANLVTCFKRSAVDQTLEEVRCFEVKAFIEEVISTLDNRLKQSAIQVQLNCSADLTIKSRPGILEQILTHLIMNSLIHGFENGKNAGTISITVTLIEKLIHIEYVDTGKGIEPKVLEKIFEPFFTTNRACGTGLGLYICYNMITTHSHGTISCESTPGQGVVFKIDYPIS